MADRLTAANIAALRAWLAYCERHPDKWAVKGEGALEIPLAPLGMTFDEVDALFDRPTLAEVRQAVEELCAEQHREEEPGG